MQHHVASDRQALLELKPAWDSLIDESVGVVLPLSWDWFDCWWQWFGETARPRSGASLRVHWFESDGRVVAIFPLRLRRVSFRNLPASCLSAMANGHSPYWDALLADELKDSDVRDLFQQILLAEAPDVVELTRIAEQSRLRKVICSTKARAWRYGDKDVLITPIIDTTQTWDHWLAARPRKFRQNLSRKLRDLANDESLDIECHILRERSDEAFEDAVAISANSWKADVGNDLGSNEAGRKFLRELIDRLAPAERACVWICKKDGKPIGYELHIRDANVTFPIRADYDRRYSKLSPGSLVECHALRAAFEDNSLKVYDSCADDYPYLRNLTSDVRRSFKLQVFPKRWQSSLLWALEFRLIPFLRMLRKTASKKK